MQCTIEVCVFGYHLQKSLPHKLLYVPQQQNSNCTNGSDVATYNDVLFAACPTGTWGKDCLRDCNCRDSDTACNETTGCAECPGGFTGGDCREDIDECKVNDPCDGHSTCSNTIGTFKCVCHAGYTQYNATVCQGKQHVITTLYNSYVMDATLVLFVCVLCPRLDCFNSNALNRPRLPS